MGVTTASCSIHKAGATVVPIWYWNPGCFVKNRWFLFQEESWETLVQLWAKESAAVHLWEISSKARGEGQDVEGKILILWPHPSHLGCSLKVLAIVGLGLPMAIKAIRTSRSSSVTPSGWSWQVDIKTNRNCCPVVWILSLLDTFLLCRNWWFFWNRKVCWQFRSLKCGVLSEGYTDLSRSQMKCRRKSRLSLGDSRENMPALTSLCTVSIVKVPHFPWFDEDSRALKIWIAIIPKSNSIQFSSRPLLGNKTGISYFN